MTANLEIKFKGVNRFKTVWVARILGEDPKYGLKREFLGKRWFVSKCYYSFQAELREPGVYEVKEPGSHKYSFRRYIRLYGDGAVEELGTVEEGASLPGDLKAKILKAVE